MLSTFASAPVDGTRGTVVRTLIALLKPLGIAVALLAGLALSGAIAQTTPLIEMRDLGSRELRTEGIALSRAQDVRINAIGAEASESNGTVGWIKGTLRTYNITSDDAPPAWQGNAWILDARTRAVVWELRAAETKRERRDLRRFDGTIRLQPGTYEVRYASYTNGAGSGRWFSSDDDARDNGLSRNFSLYIESDASGARRVPRSELARARDEFTATAVVSLTNVGPSRSERMGFTLEQPTELEVYAIGEARRDGAFDYGWIINTATRRKVWELAYRFSDAAGGADKNRSERRTLTLPAGRYAAIFATDDSHDPSEWNSAPPFDPSFYGLTIRVNNPSDRSRVKTFAYDPWPSGTPVVALTRMRDHDSRSAGFSLTRDADVRVYALGEESGDDMADYGWIVDAATHRRVWAMDADDTQHAGGAEKNRLSDRVIRLPKGSYLVHYTTDDSHSFDDWNSAPPIDPEHWGISIYPATDSDRAAFGPYEEQRDGNVVAEILRVGDDEHERTRFTLDRDDDVRVYAIGEGSDDEMFDYAWIESAKTREIVWEMTYRGSEHAGGANKNRQISEVVRLPAGEYILHYRSDGSHSYRDWNAEPPIDPKHWGVTVSRVRK